MVCVFSPKISRTRVVVGESENADSGSLLHDGWQELCRLSSFVLERETVQKSEAERASLVCVVEALFSFSSSLVGRSREFGIVSGCEKKIGAEFCARERERCVDLEREACPGISRRGPFW
jgi:hypothetical protein